jgi:2-polyprenyl-6-methoxyphenol hydroxylase-like FAD-dependent oxidoreductase
MTRQMVDRDRFGGRRAIVIGGSMAGLVTARVLADHFDEVLLVERDALLDTDEPRKGVPQGRQLHALLTRGEEILSALFPGLIDALVAAGGELVDFSRDLRWHHFGVDKVRFDSGVRAITVTRPFLEREVRRRLFALPGVRRLDQREVLGLLAGEDRRRVTGVTLRRRDGEGAAEAPEELLGDLVVDACGRGSHTPKWLEALGYARPEETVVKVNVCYATRLYRRPEPTGLPYKGLYILGTPPASKRLGVLAPIEGGRWIALVAGLLGDHPDADPQAFLDFARSLPIDDLYRVLNDAEPLGDVALYKFPSHQRRHYERMDRFPESFVVLGDSHCSFNPIYGQGMTTAALGAVLLGACLGEQRRERGGSILGLSRRFQARVARETDVPWSMALSEDLRYPEIEAHRPFGYALMKWYLGRVHRAAGRDEEVALHFLRAMHMIEPPTRLLAPALVARVLAGGRASDGATPRAG